MFRVRETGQIFVARFNRVFSIILLYFTFNVFVVSGKFTTFILALVVRNRFRYDRCCVPTETIDVVCPFARPRRCGLDISYKILHGLTIIYNILHYHSGFVHVVIWLLIIILTHRFNCLGYRN